MNDVWLERYLMVLYLYCHGIGGYDPDELFLENLLIMGYGELESARLFFHIYDKYYYHKPWRWDVDCRETFMMGFR